MSIDMSQFYQVFFEEAQEHLDTMETLLLGLDLDAPDAEQLNAIFRAAHSIKGSAGTFGFTDLTKVTHILESLLDRIRKGELALRPEMLDAFLAAGDVLKGQLAAHRDKGMADPAKVISICERLSELTTAPPAPAAAPAPQAEAAAAANAVAAQPSTGELEASFILDMNAQASAKAIDDLLAELGGRWTVAVIQRACASNPRWRLRVGAGADPDIVRGMLEFVARSDSIRVAAAGATATDANDGDGAYGLFDAVPPAPTLSAADSEAAAPPTWPVTERRSAPRPAAAETSIRVDVDKVDQLVNLIGELVITQSMLTQSAATLDPVRFERLHTGLVQLERNTRDMQEAVMSIRMMPISVVFARFPRVVRDLAQKLGKQIELRTEGEGTELDKGLIERISDPLTHLVRNSIDHGVELPTERSAHGKPPTGTITLRAYHRGGNVVIEVVDDGAGLNRQKILAKAREKGLPTHDRMSDGDIWQLIFEPGFSTAEQVTEVSGRGVGMDVVKRNIAAMGGRVDIQSTTGVGTRMTVRLPLTLAILDGMSVAVGNETYIIPLSHVLESLQVERGMVKSVSGVERLVHVHGEYLPVVALYELFGIPGSKTRLDDGIMVVVEAEGTRAALFIDDLLGQHPVVIKNLESNYRKVPGISAATIMGDGHVALILDVAALVQMAKSALPEAA